MKNLSLVFALFFSLSASAQLDEELLYFNGGLAFGTGETSSSLGLGSQMNTSSNSFYLRAGGGYMLTEMFGAGISLGFQSADTQMGLDSLSMPSTTTLFTIAPEARMYLEVDKHLYFTTVFAASLGFGNTTTTFLDEEFSMGYNVFDFGFRPGFSYFLSDKLSLDITAGYIGYMITSNEVNNPLGEGTITATSGSFQFLTDMSSLTLGITWFPNN